MVMRIRQRTISLILAGFFTAIAVVISMTLLQTRNRTVIQIDILQNQEIIHLSTFAEPPQFAIWLEDSETGKCKQVFVTHRAAVGDWEGKSEVPVALPKWFDLFKINDKSVAPESGIENEVLAITGATPQDDYFSIRAEVKPGSRWICWIEMNLAGDYNTAFPEYNPLTHAYDEFACGQPALLYRADIPAQEGIIITPQLTGQSIWKDGVTSVEEVSEGVGSALYVFDSLRISVTKPKPKLIGKKKNLLHMPATMPK